MSRDLIKERIKFTHDNGYCPICKRDKPSSCSCEYVLKPILEKIKSLRVSGVREKEIKCECCGEPQENTLEQDGFLWALEKIENSLMSDKDTKRTLKVEENFKYDEER